MSALLMGRVLSASPYRGQKLLLALVIADAASNDGDGIFISARRLAELSRASIRFVYKTLHELRDEGWLEVQEAPKGEVVAYRISRSWIDSTIQPIPCQNGTPPLHAVQTPPAHGAGVPLHTVQGLPTPPLHGVQGSNKDRARAEELNSNSNTNSEPPLPPLKPPSPSTTTPPGLDFSAWTRWVEYRSAIRKPIRPPSILAAQRKLATYGPDQGDVVDQSIANGWQGLFPLHDAPAEHPVTRITRLAVEKAKKSGIEAFFAGSPLPESRRVEKTS